MRSVIGRHVAISILLGEGVFFVAVYLIFGGAAVFYCAIALLAGWILWLVIVAEKLSASSRKNSSS